MLKNIFLFTIMLNLSANAATNPCKSVDDMKAILAKAERGIRNDIQTTFPGATMLFFNNPRSLDILTVRWTLDGRGNLTCKYLNARQGEVFTFQAAGVKGR